MPKKNIILKKQVDLDHEKKLKNLWTSRAGELLILSYDYFPVLLPNGHDDRYKDVVEVAVEEFNQLGLAQLVYRPAKMLRLFKHRPLNKNYLKLKHKNPILFSHSVPENEHGTALCDTVTNKLSYKIPREYDILSYIDNPQRFYEQRVISFAEISCNTYNEFFQRFSVGIILEQINHIFAVKQANTSSSFSAPNDSLLSPFSIQYTDANASLARMINKTWLNKLLDAYDVGATIKGDYFYLLEKYSGHPYLYTGYDIAALATAIYKIAPDSLLAKKFNFLNYHLIKSAYLPRADKQKLIVVAEALGHAENFNYPILAKKKLTVIVKKSEHFFIDLVKELKAVSLVNHLSCSIQKKNLPFESGNLSIPTGCTLIGRMDTTGVFNLFIVLKNAQQRITRRIRLVVEEKNRILLGIKEAVYPIKKNQYYHINLQEVCEAVAWPAANPLYCGVADTDLKKYTVVGNCRVEFQALANLNLSVMFLNGYALKSCRIQFLLEETLHLENEHTLSYFPKGIFDYRVKREQRHDVEAEFAYREASLLSNQIETDFQSYQLYNLATPFNYCIVLPFSQGVLEGAIDGTSLPVYVKSGLKILPRISLWYLDYFNLLNFSLIASASLLEGVVKNYVKNKVTVSAEKFISIAIFLSITELEYGFSNLWTLTDQPRFWPELTDRFNQLFLQWFFSPMIKTLGYTLAVSLMNVCLPLVDKIQAVSETSLPMKSSVVAAMQDACQTVFSRKTFKLFSFFKANSTLAEAVSRSDEVSICLKQ